MIMTVTIISYVKQVFLTVVTTYVSLIDS